MTIEGRQERKVVTVLFCDLVGFTQRSEELDPEDVASLLAPYHARVKEELERFGGTVEKFIGDAVMALFGAPVAHEDDPERAVRAALAIRDYAREHGLELRVGITTGDALVTLGARPDLGETMATGDVVNTAARLQAAAPVNGVLVGERTRAATQGTIEYPGPQEIEAKGKARPIPAFEALSVRDLSRVESETPLVGRDRDLQLLADTLARVERERSCQLVTIVGVPGVGKSRLVRELAKLGSHATWREGRCLPYGDGVTLWALGEIVKAELDVLDSDSGEIVEQKLTEAVADEWVRAQLRPLVGRCVEGIGETEGREQRFVAWRRFLEGAAESRTLALFFEDLHWAGDDLLDFVDHLVDWAGGIPLFVVCTGRPELLERRPTWGGGKANALTVSLSALSDEDTTRLLGALIEDAVVPTSTQHELLRRAGGNPLYAEQFARMLGDDPSDSLSLPETVQGVIAARLDLLETAQKSLLQDASVFGDEFWLGAVAAISDADVRTAEVSLHALERKGFVHRQRESWIEDDLQYGFTHVLVREVAYAQIPRGQRSEKHRRAAEWIDALGRREDHAELLAHHYGEALALAQAARSDAGALAESAARAFGDAGDRALALYSYERALRLYERALELSIEPGAEHAELLFRRARAHFHAVEDDGLEPLEEARDALVAVGARESAGEVEVLEARKLLSMQRFPDALERARRAAARLDDAPPSPAKARVLANCARIYSIAGLPDDALEVAHEALATSEQLALGELRANVLSTLGVIRVSKCDFGGLADLEEGHRLAVGHGSPDEILRDRNNLAWSYARAGRWPRASEWFLAHLDAAERFGMRLAVARAMRALDCYVSGEWRDGVRLMEEVLAEDSPVRPLVLRLRATMRTACGDAEGSAQDFSDLRSHLEGSAATADSVFLIWLGRAALEQERRDLATELAVEALGRAGEWFGIRPDLELLELAFLLADLDLSLDRVVELTRGAPASPWYPVVRSIASGDLISAADRLAAFGTSAYEAYARLRGAERLLAAGRATEADEQVRKAVSFYRSVDANRYVEDAEALLAASA
jgi:class 3 adenylate cyclase/tetratricopeptide (TPR) repeat protein